jgi:tetratricopeptide (TPR) repeat protein
MNTLQKYEKYFYLIILIGIIIYFPIFFNGFVWDDYSFIINNPQVHQFNLLMLFGNNEFNDGPFYRPIPAVYFAIAYSMFGNTAFFYHLIQLILHIAGTFLLFIFLCTLFSEYIALFLALIFLVHPINVESVAYIGSTQSQLYFIPGISALLLAQKKHLPQRRLYTIILLLLLSVFTKEVGFLFIILVFVYRIIFRLGELKKLSLFTGLLAVFYLCMRIFYGGVTYSMGTFIPVAALPLSQRILNIPSIILYYIKTFLFPLTLAIWQFWIITTISLTNFILPLFLSILLIGLLIFTAYLLFRRRKLDNKHDKQYFQTYVFFFIWFVIGMGILLQIVPLDMTVADRWFYFPIVGLLGMIGVSLSAWLPSYKTYKRRYMLIAAIVLLLFASRTFIRTLDYKNEITLYRHDIQVNSRNYMLLNNYGEDLIKQGSINKGCQYVKSSVALSPGAPSLNELGDCYEGNQEYTQALSAYKQGLKLAKTEQWNHTSLIQANIIRTLNNYGEYLINQGNLDDGCTYIQRSIDLSPTVSSLNELGNCYELDQKYNDSIKAYSRSLQLSQSQPLSVSSLPIYLNMAHVLLVAGRLKDSANFIHSVALKKFPGNQQLLQLLNEAELEENNPQPTLQNTAPNSASLQNQELLISPQQ